MQQTTREGPVHDVERRSRRRFEVERLEQSLQLLAPTKRAVFLQPIQVLGAVRDELAASYDWTAEDEAEWLHGLERWLRLIAGCLAQARLKVMSQDLGGFEDYED